jgi:hypothetical protein
MRALRLVFFAVFVVVLAACGGKKEDAKAVEKKPSFDDAFALLPSNPILLGTVDARAFFASQTFGAQLTQNVEKLVPIGQEAGFSAARDVDRVTFASYSYQGLDVAAIVVGRFDAAKIKASAANGTATRNGVPLVVSQYAERDIYTVNNAGFTVLSERVAVAGSESGIRRVLDRIKDNRVKRDIPQWMLTHVESPGASAAVVADLATQPVPPDVLRQVPLPFVQNLKAVRALVNFKDTGLQIAGSMTYPDDAAAQSAQASVKDAMNLSRWLALIGVKIQNPTVTVEKTDVQVTLAVDDQSLRTLLATVPQLTGQK